MRMRVFVLHVSDQFGIKFLRLLRMEREPLHAFARSDFIHVKPDLI